MGDNNKAVNSNNSETLYNVIQNKRQSSRNQNINNNGKQFNLNLDDTSNNRSVFNLNRSGSPCLPNFGSMSSKPEFNSKYQESNSSSIGLDLMNGNKKKKNSVTEIDGNLLVQHEWATDEDEDSDVQAKAMTPKAVTNFNTVTKKPSQTQRKKTWINIDKNYLSGTNDSQSSGNLLKLNTAITLDESDTLSDYNSAGCEVDGKNCKDNNQCGIDYLKLNKESMYHKYTTINKREDKRIKLGMKSSVYCMNLKTNNYQTKQELLKNESMYKKSKMFSMSVAKKSCNFKRNRYSDIAPYNYNRIRLDVLEDEQTGSLSNDYINASKIILDSIDPENPEVLIATQGPTKYTYEQFWQMVYDQCMETSMREIIIVMVTPLIENGREKCYPYWPSKNTNRYVTWKDSENLIPKLQFVGQSASVFKQDLKLKVLNEEQVNSHYYTTLELADTASNQKIKVHHLYYDKWEDFSSPTSISQVIDLIKHTNELRRSKDIKVISHCSAGVGRTGTFFALYYLYNSFVSKSLSQSALSDPVESTVSQLRECRMKMVQTFEQYKFIYEVVKQLYDDEISIA
ncbi:uncharacterized protein HGUI_03143 [Hanseniaspora guilliermondii]|uniref:Tyrosine-protein phosphatase 1 n=1 Tax=Hanseniaspora guilliermondii TaxID=56406 RepID=A0A1L0D1E0_9ASCO|nr:uncharacterized protein HGUI_03143 [Hanseniaspora guilliermondii]